MEPSPEATASCTGEGGGSTSGSPEPSLVDERGQPVPALRTFYLYLTEGCNLACRHCWLSPPYQANGSVGTVLDPDLLEQAIVDAKPLGLAAAKLTGGEPTLHPRLADICARLQRHGIRFWMESNGIRIGPDDAARLHDLGLGFCSVSLDGASAATHDRQRGVAGAFDKALAGMASLVASGIDTQAIMTLTRDNVGELFDVIRLAARFGCHSVKINLLEPTGRGRGLSRAGQGLTTGELLDLGARVEASKAEAGIPLHYSWPPAFWPIRRLLRGDAGTCGILGILGILADGTMAMCGIGRHEPDLVYGRLGRSSLADTWLNHDRLRELRAVRPVDFEGVCGECLHGSTCFGELPSQRLQWISLVARRVQVVPGGLGDGTVPPFATAAPE